ncbi:MAG: (2Fe-2S)-binding protein [Acidimicrobiales bacterium]
MTTTREITISVNGATHRLEVEPRRLLVHCLRDDLGLTGTHVGCETAQCGACVVVVDGVLTKACNVLAVQSDGTAIDTIEGVASDGHLDPLQQAFIAAHAVQCGYCTPGMIMTASTLLHRDPHPDDHTIRLALDGNLCRCTGYHNIVDAVRRAADGVEQSGTKR